MDSSQGYPARICRERHNTQISDKDLKDLTAYLKSPGLIGAGFTRGPARRVFKDKAIRYANGRMTCVDNERCFPFFLETHGCSICIKVCPFNTAPYEKLKEKHEAVAGKL